MYLITVKEGETKKFLANGLKATLKPLAAECAKDGMEKTMAVPWVHWVGESPRDFRQGP